MANCIAKLICHNIGKLGPPGIYQRKPGPMSILKHIESVELRPSQFSTHAAMKGNKHPPPFIRSWQGAAFTIL